MDRLSFFEYSARSAWLLRVDARAKLAAMVLLSLALLSGGPAALVPVSMLTVLYFIRGPRPVGRLWHGLRWFAPLLALMIAARGLTEPAGPYLDLGAVTLSQTGLRQGAVFAWRLVLMVALGAMLTATTAPSAIKAAVTWYLQPLPLVPAHRVGTMLALLLRFIPLVFSQARQTLDAQRARAVECRKNPLYRLRRFILPFFRRTLLTADQIAEAMEARCYHDERTAYQAAFTAGDGWFLGAVTGLAGIMLVL